MNLPAPFLCLAACAVATCQDPLPTTVRAVDAARTLTGTAGLQRAGDGVLRGGGSAYRVSLRGGGMRFEPALGAAAGQTAYVELTPVAVRRGTEPVLEPRPATRPAARERVAVYEHAPGVQERYDVRPEGVELSWWFASTPAGAGDLVVRYELATSLPAPRAAGGGLELVLPGIGGVRIGDVTGIDANGARADGDVRWVDGGLELSLPASFVDTAAYPLVLDPLIGGVFDVIAVGNDDTEPDAAYDATTNRWLVVWRRVFSASDADVRGQLVNNGGTLSGGTIFFGSTGVASRPRVANLGVRDRFAVVWTQNASGTSTIEMQTVEAGNGTLSFSAVVATSAATQFGDCDVGTQCEAPVGTSRGIVVVYEDNDADAIQARRYWFNSSDVLVSSSPFALFTNTLLGSGYVQPAIARTASADGDLLVVARRTGGLLGGSGIVARLVDAGSNTPPTAGSTVVSSTENDLFVPDVDGYAGKWVVAWERAGTSTGTTTTYDAVRVAPVELVGSTLSVGSTTTFGGTIITRATAPSLGYTPGRTWLGYQSSSLLSPTSLRAIAIDSDSCANCTDSFTVGSPAGPRIVVATMTSGGLTTGEDCLAVFHDSGDDIRAQRLRNYGTNGSYTNLGGSCGNAGTLAWSHDPGIGSSGLRNTLSGVPATALAAIFNFSAPSATIPCGPCVWLPFSVTLSPPILGTTAVVEFPIPCIQALVGQQFEAQWTVIDFSQQPCPLFPGLALSNRSRMTIGD